MQWWHVCNFVHVCDSEECCSCIIGRNYDVCDSRWNHQLDGNENSRHFQVLIKKLSSRAIGKVEYDRRTVNQGSVANTHILLIGDFYDKCYEDFKFRSDPTKIWASASQFASPNREWGVFQYSEQFWQKCIAFSSERGYVSSSDENTSRFPEECSSVKACKRTLNKNKNVFVFAFLGFHVRNDLTRLTHDCLNVFHTPNLVIITHLLLLYECQVASYVKVKHVHCHCMLVWNHNVLPWATWAPSFSGFTVWKLSWCIGTLTPTAILSTLLSSGSLYSGEAASKSLPSSSTSSTVIEVPWSHLALRSDCTLDSIIPSSYSEYVFCNLQTRLDIRLT